MEAANQAAAVLMDLWLLVVRDLAMSVMSIAVWLCVAGRGLCVRRRRMPTIVFTVCEQRWFCSGVVSVLPSFPVWCRGRMFGAARSPSAMAVRVLLGVYADLAFWSQLA